MLNPLADDSSAPPAADVSAMLGSEMARQMEGAPEMAPEMEPFRSHVVSDAGGGVDREAR